jgi:putative hydrolase of the HAD superfamily
VAAQRFEAVVFDIGGVLEHTPRTGWEDPWCERLGLDRVGLHDRLRPLWLAGTIGAISLDDVQRGVGVALGFERDEVVAFMEGLWVEYLGTPNTELIGYFGSLRSRFATGILSNSFVGARERERERYGFEAICDAVIYSHEEGMKKPDPAFYRLACRRLGVEPQATVFVDDTDDILAGALDVGMTPVKFIGQRQTIVHIEAVLAGRAGGWSPPTASGAVDA